MTVLARDGRVVGIIALAGLISLVKEVKNESRTPSALKRATSAHTADDDVDDAGDDALNTITPAS